MVDYAHVPVLVQQVLDLLNPEAGRRYLDGTLGGGGHTEQLLERSGPDGQVLGLDCDGEAVAAAQRRLERFENRLVARWANFSMAGEILGEIGWGKVNGILLDLGLSSHQIESPGRGFSFKTEDRLDMRMDCRQTLDAHCVVNTFPVFELERIIREFGEEPWARRIAMSINAERRKKAIETTRQLAEIVAGVVRRGKTRSVMRRSRIHPATKTFQALRIAVNREMENLTLFLENAYELLLSKGRIVVISFHSLEDRIVKKAFWKWSRSCLCPPKIPLCRCGWRQKARVLTPKPLFPSRDEIHGNPRARSAKLRAAERV